MINGVWVPIIMFSSIPVIVIGLPLARAFAKRMEQEPPSTSIPPEVMLRLERMEHALDTIAVEVERISEGQRFTTKLLSERTGGPSKAPERVS